MPVPVVVVEIAPPNAPVELARSLVAACSGAIDQGRCSLVADEPDDVVPRAIAIVSWDGAEHLRVRIEVGIRRAERAQWLSRTMSFRAEDDPAERWKAAGLTVATLVGEVVPPSQSAVRPDDARKPAGPPPARSTSAPVDTAHASEALPTARNWKAVCVSAPVSHPAVFVLGPWLPSATGRRVSLFSHGCPRDMPHRSAPHPPSPFPGSPSAPARRPSSPSRLRYRFACAPICSSSASA